MLNVINFRVEEQGSDILNRYIAVWMLICGVLLTACNGAASPTNSVTPVVAGSTQDTASADTATTEAPALAAPTVAVTNTIQVAGDLNLTVEADNYYVAPVKANDESVVATMLYLNQSDTHVVFIRFPKDAQPGTYPILSGYTEDFDGSTTTANYIDQTGDPAIQFAATGGTLTLQSSGDTYAGTFEFPATDPATGERATISGTFANLKMP